MSTKYGTISTAPLSSYQEEGTRSDIGIRRPWKEMVSFSSPETFSAALQRIKTNKSYFHANYTIIVLFLVFLSLLWHPVSLIVSIFTVAAWLLLYFLCDGPVLVFGYVVGDIVILMALSVFTVVMLLLTHRAMFTVAMAVGFVVLVVHATFRTTDGHISDLECEGERVDLEETASDSYSSRY